MHSIVSVAYMLDDDTPLRPSAQRHNDGALGVVQLGARTDPHTAIQSTSPEALRRLAAALMDAADQADRITAASAA